VQQVLCVCVGNISRSPMMSALLQRELGGGFVVESAGLDRDLVGRPANHRSVDCMYERGIDLSGHISRWIGSVALDGIGWIVTVGLDEARRVRTHLGDHSAAIIVANAEHGGIPDPYELGVDGYRESAALLDRVLPGVAEQIRASERSDRVVFWDFDGTLARRENLWSGALLDAWRRVDDQTAGTVEQLRPHLRDRFPWHNTLNVRPPQTPAEWWAALHPMFVDAYTALGVDAVRADEAASHVPVEFYRRDAWTVIDGAEQALLVTKTAGYRNIILSNHAPELPALVDTLGLGSLVEQTFTSAAIGAEKPNPAIFEFAIDRAGVTAASNVWMIGDNPIADVQGARNVGMQAILADGAHPDSTGMTVLEAACYIVAFADEGR
jgi:putative hydrolase of the HAD superfamily